MPVTVAEARARAAKAVANGRREWAVLADPRSASDWADSWRDVRGEGGTRGDGMQLRWVQKNWPSIGRQDLPEWLTLYTADVIARFAGREVFRDWTRIRDRAAALRENFGDDEPVVAEIQRRGGAIDRLTDADFALLLEVLKWLRQNPSSGYRLRQVPIPGMHTKWLGAHRVLVESLYAAITGDSDLGLVASPETLRIRVLDSSMRPGGLIDVSAPIDEIAALPLAPRVVVVCENLESVLALPDWPGAVAVHGGGYAVAIHRLPWARPVRILYWGDLDADGFAILHRLRANGVDAISVRMDERTLLAYRELWVPDPNGVVARTLPTLVQAEQTVLDRIAAEGGVRLEQERLPWPMALAALRAAAGELHL